MSSVILAFDTSTKTASAALVTLEGELVARRDAPAKTHGKALAPLLSELLRSAEVEPDQLAGVACGKGPGSFTGVRVGLATAKGMCLAASKPLVLVSSLTGLAERRDILERIEPGDLVVPCLDARRGEVYLSVVRPSTDGERGEVELEPLIEETACPPEKVAKLLVSSDLPKAGRLLVAGTGAKLLEGVVDSRSVGSLHIEVLTSIDGWPDGEAIGRIGAARLKRGDVDDLDSAQPTYLRPSDAEEKLGLDLSPPA
jgi:tRNA threonylcarbamoyl adenosine modification protein YeaZ